MAAPSTPVSMGTARDNLLYAKLIVADRASHLAVNVDAVLTEPHQRRSPDQSGNRLSAAALP
jgi:hypothetical protein